MLELEIYPERGVGNETIEFTLGMPFQFAVTSLRKQHLTIRAVHVVYNDSDPLANDLVLQLPHDGLTLYFDSYSQTLKVVEVFDLSIISLKYCGSVICSNGTVPTIEKIDHCFGATHPGVYDPANQLFELKFRGLQFQFPVDQQISNQVTGLGAIQFNTAPLVSKMHIYSGNCLSETVAPSVPLQYFYGNIFADSVEGEFKNNRLQALKFILLKEEIISTGLRSSERKKKIEKFLTLGDSCQQVISTFGSPNKVFYKPNDKMRIHTPSGLRINDDKVSHYFLNYFTLGVDVLIDGAKHVVIKIILHTNFPCHYHFNIYHRCQFSITLPSQDSSQDSLKITPFTKWDNISESSGTSLAISERPVVLNRASSDNNTNPFGPTFCYNIANCIVEVMPNNYIASFTVFDDETTR